MTRDEVVDETEARLAQARFDLVMGRQMWGDRLAERSLKPHVDYYESVLQVIGARRETRAV